MQRPYVFRLLDIQPSQNVLKNFHFTRLVDSVAHFLVVEERERETERERSKERVQSEQSIDPCLQKGQRKGRERAER